MKIFTPTDCKGQALVIVAISIIVLLVLVGLAIDSGRAYLLGAGIRLNGGTGPVGLWRLPGRSLALPFGAPIPRIKCSRAGTCLGNE